MSKTNPSGTGESVDYIPGHTGAVLPSINLHYEIPWTITNEDLNIGVDYDVIGDSNNSAGQHMLQIHFKGDYRIRPDIYLQYTVNRLDLSDAKYQAKAIYDENALIVPYIGRKNYPALRVYFTYDKKEYELTREADYTAVALEGSKYLESRITEP